MADVVGLPVSSVRSGLLTELLEDQGLELLDGEEPASVGLVLDESAVLVDLDDEEPPVADSSLESYDLQALTNVVGLPVGSVRSDRSDGIGLSDDNVDFPPFGEVSSPPSETEGPSGGSSSVESCSSVPDVDPGPLESASSVHGSGKGELTDFVQVKSSVGVEVQVGPSSGGDLYPGGEDEIPAGVSAEVDSLGAVEDSDPLPLESSSSVDGSDQGESAAEPVSQDLFVGLVVE